MLAAEGPAPPSSTDAIGSDLLVFLARIEEENPAATAAAVQAEVDTLLRRPPAVNSAANVATVSGRKPRRTASSAFDWYQPIAARIPPVRDTEETVAAAKWVEAGLLAQEALCSGADLPTDLRSQLLRVVSKGQSEFEGLILSNLRLVFHWSKGVATSVGYDEVQDAFQYGCIGLIRGLQGWDYTMGYQLSTFVSWHIRQQIQRWRMNETSLIRVPVHVWERMDADPSALAPNLLAAAKKALAIVHLDDDEEDLDYGITIDRPADVLEDLVLRLDRQRAVNELLAHLDKRSALIIRLRHGLDAGTDEPLTLDAIGELFGLTRERIRQIEKKAMERLIFLAREAHIDDLL